MSQPNEPCQNCEEFMLGEFAAREANERMVKQVAALTKENELHLEMITAQKDTNVNLCENIYALEAENSRLREEVQMVMKMADGTDNILLVGRKKWDEVNSQLSAAREALKEIIEEFPNNHSDLPKWKAALTTPQSPESAVVECDDEGCPHYGKSHSHLRAEPAAHVCHPDPNGECLICDEPAAPKSDCCGAKMRVHLRMSASEYQRLVEWMKDPDRKDANTAFTSGACRDAARAFQDAKQPAGMKERIEELEKALYYMQNCKYEPDKLLCIYERTIPLKRRDALREQGREEKGV